MRSYVNIIDVERKKEKNIKLPDLKNVFSLKELKIKEIKLVLDTHKKKYETYYPILQGKITFYGTIKQLVTTEDDRHFSRELQIRIDDTRHDGYDLHINLDLIDRHIETDKIERHNLGEFHMTLIKDRVCGLFFVSMSIPGKSIGIPVVYFIKKEDLEYHKQQQKFLKKLRKGKLKKEDELEFKKAFDQYYEILQNRKKIKLVLPNKNDF